VRTAGGVSPSPGIRPHEIPAAVITQAGTCHPSSTWAPAREDLPDAAVFLQKPMFIRLESKPIHTAFLTGDRQSREVAPCTSRADLDKNTLVNPCQQR